MDVCRSWPRPGLQGGYPCFIQVLGQHCWNIAIASYGEINGGDVATAISEARNDIDAGLYTARWQRHPHRTAIDGDDGRMPSKWQFANARRRYSYGDAEALPTLHSSGQSDLEGNCLRAESRRTRLHRPRNGRVCETPGHGQIDKHRHRATIDQNIRVESEADDAFYGPPQW